MKSENGCSKVHMKFSSHPSGVGNSNLSVMHRVDSTLDFDSVSLVHLVVQAQ